MDRVRPAMLIAARVVDVGRRLPRRGGFAVPAPARLIRVWMAEVKRRMVELHLSLIHI